MDAVMVNYSELLKKIFHCNLYVMDSWRWSSLQIKGYMLWIVVELFLSQVIHSAMFLFLPLSSSASATVVEINTLSSFLNICHSQFLQTDLLLCMHELLK